MTTATTPSAGAARRLVPNGDHSSEMISVAHQRSPRGGAGAAPRGGAGAAALVLVGVTAAWGSTFPLLHGVVREHDPADVLALRFSIAAVALFAVAPRAVLRRLRAAAPAGVLLGLLYGVGQLLQTIGLQHTSASVSGFVTGLYVVLTPLLGAALLRRSPTRAVWAAVGLATAGLAVLSLDGFGIGPGELLTAASALVYALHILGLGAWSRPQDVVASAFVQMTVCAVLCTLVALPGGIGTPSGAGDWAGLLYLAVVAGALALIGQTWAQARLPAARAAIIMTLEPVWAGAFAVTLGGESVTGRLLVGGGLVLAAMALAELPARRHAADADGSRGTQEARRTRKDGEPDRRDAVGAGS